ncbi:hypothetical protein T4B_7997, partial [Trichinella pseudospiralis]
MYKSPLPRHCPLTLYAKGAFPPDMFRRISIPLYFVPSNKLQSILSRPT